MTILLIPIEDSMPPAMHIQVHISNGQKGMFSINTDTSLSSGGRNEGRDRLIIIPNMIPVNDIKSDRSRKTWLMSFSLSPIHLSVCHDPLCSSSDIFLSAVISTAKHIRLNMPVIVR